MKIAPQFLHCITSLGFGSALTYMIDFNKSIIQTSGSFIKYGVGVNAVTDGMQRISKETTLTRKESLELMKLYERGFNYVSIQQATQLMMNLKNLSKTGGMKRQNKTPIPSFIII